MAVPESYYDTLIALLETHGGPGWEDAVSDRMTALFSEYTHQVEKDTLGNVMATVQGEGTGRRPRVMLGAHMDEIALVVSAVEPGGFLRVAQSGGFDPRTLVGQEVLVHGRETLLGIVGSKPPHLTSPEERSKAATLEDLFIDLGRTDQELTHLVHIGDRITLQRTSMELCNGRFAGKALDNRTSLAIELECLRMLRELRHEADVIAVATVQEEVGVRGAETSAYHVLPDIAIAIDVTWADMPGQPADLSFKLGKGPVVVFGPNVHPKVFQALKQTATKHRIPWQLELSQSPTGTDGRAFQIAADGVATGVIGICIRYMHTSVETGSYDDILESARLLAHFIASVDVAMVEGLSCY